MNFNNLTNEQVEWLEGKIEEAYDEGASDQAEFCNALFEESLAKNQTCHILAERFMKPVEELIKDKPKKVDFGEVSKERKAFIVNLTLLNMIKSGKYK